MALKDRIIKKAGRAFDKVRPRVMPGVRFFLLKATGQTSKLSLVAEITSGHFVKWNPYREQMQFKLASNDAALLDQFAQISYIGYGIPNGANQVDVFAISADARDRIAPVGTSPFWKLFGERKPEMRFTVTSAATGYYTFGANPVDGDAFPELNGYGLLVFKDSPSAWFEIQIGGTLTETIENMIAAFTDQSVFTEVVFTSDATHLFLTFATNGADGNAFTLGDATANITPSGATLSGGAG